jgi:hypothetical protein
LRNGDIRAERKKIIVFHHAVDIPYRQRVLLSGGSGGAVAGRSARGPVFFLAELSAFAIELPLF